MYKSSIIVLILLLVISCSKNEDQQKQKKIIGNSYNVHWVNKNLNVNVNNLSIILNANYSNEIASIENNYNKYYVDVRTNIDTFSLILNSIKETLSIPKNNTDIEIISIAFYQNGPPSELNINLVKGFSLYYIENNSQLFIQNYIKISGKFILNETFLDNRISSNFMDDFFEELNLLFPASTHNSIFISRKNLNYQIHQGRSTYRLDLLTQNLIINDNFNKMPSVPGEPQVVLYDLPNCGGLCPVMDNSICERSNLNMYNCAPLVCSENIQHEIVSENQVLTSEEIDSAYDFSLHYALKDVLLSYELGNKYINYYYALGDFLTYNDFTLDLCIATAELLIELNTQIEKILNEELYGSEIFITDELKNKFILLLEDYESLSENEDYQAIIYDIANDILWFHNKTITQIYNEFY